jgi:hypothetical protein
MSPGPLSSSHRGGLNFQHGARRNFTTHRATSFYGTRQVASPVNRAYGTDRQRFAVHGSENGGSHIVLDEGETVTVGVGEDGAVAITIDPPAEEPDNGVEVEVQVQQRRGPGARQRMTVAAAPDGSVLVEPDMGQQLVVLGDSSELLVIGEIPAE